MLLKCTNKLSTKTSLFLFFFVINTFLVFSQQDTHEIIVSGVDAMMEGNYSESLELLTKARVQAENEEDYKNLFVALNNIGLNYAKMLDNNEALEYYLESYTIAIKELDASYEMTSLNNIAVLYSQEKNIDKAIEYFEKAYDLARLPKDKLKKGIYAINLAQAYFDKRKYTIATNFIEEAIKLLESDPDYQLEALALKSILLNGIGQSILAKNLINELLPKLKENRYAETRVVLLLTLADIESNNGDINRALNLTNSALSQQPINIETRYNIFSHIAKYNKENRNYSEALIAMDSMNHLKQAIHDLGSGRQYQANRVKFEILNYETELADVQQRISFQRNIILVIALSSVIIILLLIWSLRLSRIRSKQRKDLLDRQEKILNLELENEKANNLLLEKQLKENETKLLLEQEQFKHEIESKNRKLSAKALYLTDRNRLIENIIDDLEQSEKIQPNQEITLHVRRLKGLLKSDEEWENFVQYFDEVNHGLLNRLKERHDNLNANDIRFISYLYMNLSMKEIASIMNITPEASRKRKERISKKIHLKENDDLYSYISQL
jgi:hypothetical protein